MSIFCYESVCKPEWKPRKNEWSSAKKNGSWGRPPRPLDRISTKYHYVHYLWYPCKRTGAPRRRAQTNFTSHLLKRLSRLATPFCCSFLTATPHNRNSWFFHHADRGLPIAFDVYIKIISSSSQDERFTGHRQGESHSNYSSQPILHIQSPFNCINSPSHSIFPTTAQSVHHLPLE